MDKIRIKYGPWVPWSEVIRVGNATTIGGVAKDVYESVNKALNIEFEVKLQEDLVFGSQDADGKWDGMLGSMQRNETDISGPYFLTQERATLVDFSTPIGFTELAIVSGLEAANRDPFLIFRIFAIKVWLCIILSTIVATAASSFIYVMFPSSKKRTKAEAFLRYAWMFYGSLLGKDCGSHKSWFLHPVLFSASFRILLCVWLIGPALVLMYTYQGAVTSTFAADKLVAKIRTMDDLHENKAVKPSTFGRSITQICFEALKGTKKDSLYIRVMQNLQTPLKGRYPEWLEDVESNKIAFVAETTFMKSIVGERFKVTRKCGIRVTPTEFCTAYISFAFRRNFRPKVQQVFNKRLLWFSEGHLYHRHRIASLVNYETCTRGKSATVQALKWKDLIGAFLVYAIGMSASIFILFLERMTKWKNMQRTN